MKKAQEKKLIEMRVHDLRDYTHDRHKTADDKPFGGGAGMVMKPEPIFECVEAVTGAKAPKVYKKTKAEKRQVRQKQHVVLMTPRGEPFKQDTADKLAKKKHLLFIAGHYEGVDQRVPDYLVDQELSVGDFITMGGEAPLLCMLEAIIRLVPGVLGNEDSVVYESFASGALEYPQYTRPREYRGMKVPDVLVSGNHAEVRKWREEMSKKTTRLRRPDLIRSKK